MSISPQRIAPLFSTAMSSHATTMHAYSPASYSLAMILALMIHGAIAAAILLSAYLFNDTINNHNDVFTVVGGFGDNYAATEAPALGAPDAPPDLTFTPVPDPPRPAPPHEPVVEDQPDPIAPATPVPQHALVVPPQKKTTPKPTPPPKNAPQSKISKAEYDRLHAKQNENAQFRRAPPKIASTTNTGKPVTPKPIISPGQDLLRGVDAGTGSAPGAGGTALTAAERDQMEAYFALLGERIKQAHVKPDGVSMELVTSVEYQVGADGTIGAVKILKSSGNRAFDESVLKAFRSVRPIGPRPDGRSGAKRADFRMKEE